jgi:hypothetical protein
MTKVITENSGVLIRWGVVGSLLLLVLVAFHNRISAVELQQVEQKTDIKYIKEAVDRIEARVTK